MSDTRLFSGALFAACLMSAPARAEFNFGIYDGPAATDGRIGVTVKWIEQGDKGSAESRQASVAIAVAKGDKKDSIRDRLKKALANDSQVNAAFDVSSESTFGIKCVKGAERKPTTRVTSVSIDDANVENVRLIGTLKQDELPRG